MAASALTYLEKQDKNCVCWKENTDDNKPQRNHSVLMITTHGITEGEWRGSNQWLQYRWSSYVRDSDVIGWMELSNLEKQGEQKPAWSEDDERICRCLIKDQNDELDDVYKDRCGHSEIISDLKKIYRERINWLKSLKDRIQQ